MCITHSVLQKSNNRRRHRHVRAASAAAPPSHTTQCRRGGRPRRAGLTWRSNSIHAFGLRDDHRPPYCLPSTILANKNKQVAASVVEALASHFVSNLIPVSRNRCVAKDFDTRLA